MKKILALFCIAAMLMAVPALAAPSISDANGIKVVSADVVIEDDNDNDGVSDSGAATPEKEKFDEGWYVAVLPLSDETLALYKNDAVKAAVQSVNLDDENPVTVADVAGNLVLDAEENDVTKVKLAGQEEAEEPKTVDLNEYDFVTGFSDLVLTNGTDVILSGADEAISIEAKMELEALKGVKPEDLGDYLLMFVNTESGEVSLVELDPAKFDSEKGQIDVTCPFFGAFALLQKTA